MIRAERDLRDAVERHLRRPVEDLVWEDLEEAELVQGALEDLRQGDPDVFEWLVSQVRRVERTVAEARKPERIAKQRPVEKDALPADNKMRAWRRITTHEAGRRDDVVSFRHKALRGRLIKPESVAKWVERKKAEQPHVTTYVKVPLGADGNPQLPAKGIANEEIEVLTYSAQGDKWTRAVPVCSDGPLGQLKKIATALERKYGWEESDAVAFTLAGAVPVGALISYSFEMRPSPQFDRVVLRVPVHTPARKVQELYKLARLRSRRPGRNLSEKHAELAAFIAEANDGRSWQKAMEAYNATHPKLAYMDRFRFSRDARKAYKRVMSRKLRWGGGDEGLQEAAKFHHFLTRK